MVYLGPPLDGWAYHSLVFITNKYSYWYLATIWSLSPDNLEKFDSIRTLKIWRIWKTVWCSYISKQICELKLDIFFKVISLPEEIFHLNPGQYNEQQQGFMALQPWLMHQNDIKIYWGYFTHSICREIMIAIVRVLNHETSNNIMSILPENF